MNAHLMYDKVLAIDKVSRVRTNIKQYLARQQKGIGISYITASAIYH